MSRRWKVGLVGAGAMGSHHARIIASDPACELRVVVDHQIERASALSQSVGGTGCSDHVAALEECDAVVVATRPASHHEIVVPLLERGIGVLVEKPASLREADVAMMCAAARRSGAPLACGFVQRHHPAWAMARSISAAFDAPVNSFVAERRSPPIARAETSEVMDLMIHDIDLLDDLALLADDVITTVATGDNGTRAELRYGTRIAALTADRSAGHRVRRVRAQAGAQWVEADLLDSVVSTGDGSATRSLVVTDAQEPLARQWSLFRQMMEGTVDCVAQLDALYRVHRVVFQVEAVCPPTPRSPLVTQGASR